MLKNKYILFGLAFTILGVIYIVFKPRTDMVTITAVFKDSKGIQILFKDSTINSHLIDVYFTREISSKVERMPYYLPSNSLQLDSVKQEEIKQWDEEFEKWYPKTMKKYSFNSDKLVIQMEIESSGTSYFGTFKYNTENKLVEINGTENFEIKYNELDLISKITKYKFVYGEKKEKSTVELNYK